MTNTFDILLSPIYIANQINSFIKQFSLIVINSRINSNTNRKYIVNNLFNVSQKETFDIDELFNLQEEYTFLSSPLNTLNTLSKRSYVIEIYLNCDKKPLIERWVLTYMPPNNNNNNESTMNKNYFNKKLNTLIRSCYFITRVLPAYSYKCNDSNRYRDKLYEFKVFKHKLNRETSFTSLSEVKCYKVGNSKIGICVEVKYISTKVIERNDTELVEYDEVDTGQGFMLYKRRQRFMSASVSKKKSKQSFEVLGFKEDINVVQDYFGSDKGNNKDKHSKRKLSMQCDSSNNLLNILSKDELSQLTPAFYNGDDDDDKENVINLNEGDERDNEDEDFELKFDDVINNNAKTNNSSDEDTMCMDMIKKVNKMKYELNKYGNKYKYNLYNLYKLLYTK